MLPELPQELRIRVWLELSAREVSSIARSCVDARSWLSSAILWRAMFSRYFGKQHTHWSGAPKQFFTQFRSVRPAGWLVPVAPQTLGKCDVTPDELSVHLQPATDIRKPAMWATVGNIRFKYPTTCEFFFEHIDQDCEGVVAVAYSNDMVGVEWPLHKMALKGTDLGITQPAISALASNGYKFNGMGCIPGGRIGFRHKSYVQVHTDLRRRHIEIKVRGGYNSSWSFAASFRLPAKATHGQYMILAGAKGWLQGSMHESLSDTSSRVRLVSLITHKVS